MSSPPRPPLAGGSLPARGRALQTAESLCRSPAHTIARLEKRAQQCAWMDSASSRHPPSPQGCSPIPGQGRGAAPGSPPAHTVAPAAPVGRTRSTLRPLPSFLITVQLWLPRQGHAGFTSPIRAPPGSPQYPPGYHSHRHQGVSAEPARDQASNTVEHQRCYFSTAFLEGQGWLSRAPSEARATLRSQAWGAAPTSPW